MAKNDRSWTLAELAALLNGDVEGDPDRVVRRPAPAGAGDAEGVTFAENADYLAKAEQAEVAAILVKRDAPASRRNLIRVDSPRAAFGRFLGLMARPLPIEPGIHSTAVVSPEARVAATASVGPYAVIEADATVGENCRIYPFAYVGENCHLGDGCTIYPHAVLYQDVRLGPGCVVHAGAVLGADGFGYVWAGGKQTKVPQVGGVALGADVEIGANTTIDRATAGDTLIEDDVKIDNLVQVAHNCRIGAHTVVASQVGFSGSTAVGRNCVVAGQVGTNDHVTIGDQIVLAGRTGVTGDLSKPGVYYGTPARPIVEAKRISALNVRLPELYSRIKDLEKRLAELEK